MKKKHAELIKAWADGAEIEGFNPEYQKWIPTSNPGWFPDIEYRVSAHMEKPDSVTDCFVQYLDGANIELYQDTADKNLRLKFNYWTGQLTSAEILK